MNLYEMILDYFVRSYLSVFDNRIKTLNKNKLNFEFNIYHLIRLSITFEGWDFFPVECALNIRLFI